MLQYESVDVPIPYRIEGRTASEIASAIEASIRRGDLTPGDPLPTIRAMADSLEVSPTTVASAYRTLRLRGMVTGRGRAGTTVAFRPPVAVRLAPLVPVGARNLADGSPDASLLPPIRPVLRTVRVPSRLYEERPNLDDLLALAAERFRADGVPVRDVAVVAGAMDGVERALSAQLAPGDRVAVEDPGYPAVIDLVAAMGMTAEPMAIDDAGPRPEALDGALRRGARAVVVTPRAQNPTGSALTTSRARELRRVLDRHPDVLVIEDDHAGPVAGAPAVSLASRARSRWAVVRSVGKSLGPDLRLAVLTGDPVTVSRVEGRQRLGTGWISRLLQRIVVDLWTDPRTARVLARAEEAYAERRAALVDALEGEGIRARGRSGMNVWVPVPQEAPVTRVLLDAGWAVAAGERFRLRSSPAIRVTTATLRPSEGRALASQIARSLSASTRAAHA
jgi:DNA-binding transcriptional MocR family regulator